MATVYREIHGVGWVPMLRVVEGSFIVLLMTTIKCLWLVGAKLLLWRLRILASFISLVWWPLFLRAIRLLGTRILWRLILLSLTICFGSRIDLLVRIGLISLGLMIRRLVIIVILILLHHINRLLLLLLLVWIRIVVVISLLTYEVTIRVIDDLLPFFSDLFVLDLWNASLNGWD